MAKKSVFNRAIRRLERAFAAKDEKAFDEAMSELEEKAEENSEDEQPEIEVHNHVPDYRGMDNGRGELPEKDPPGFDRRAHDEEEMPPWFKKEKEANDAKWKSMSDAIEELKKGDRRPRDESAEEEREEEREREGEDSTASEENLEIDGRHRDRRGRNRDGEVPPEFKEHQKGSEGDRRGADKRDEANKEILGELEFEAPPGTGDKARRATDSRYLEEAFQDTLAKAEVLVPGIALPTFDRKASPVKTFRTIDKLRQDALELAYNQPATRGAIDAAMGGRTMDSKRMSRAVTRTLFNSAATMVGTSNNHRATDRSSSFESRNNARGGTVGGVQSIKDLNARNREYFAAKR